MGNGGDVKQRLFRELAKEGLITEQSWRECLRRERESGEPLDRILREHAGVPEERLLAVLHRVLGLPLHRSLAHCYTPPEFVQRVPAQFARATHLCAIGKVDGAYLVATCEPLQVHGMDELAIMLEAEVDPVLAPRSEIAQLIARAYQRTADGVDEMLEGLEDDEILGAAIEIDGAEDVLDIANKAPIIRLVNTIFFEAHKMRASDIHFQPFEDELRVRYRIDGVLYDVKTIPKKVQEAVNSRIKVMGRMDIAERRLPQDGRCSIRVGDGEIDLRISSVPTAYGERIVLRLLDKTTKVFSLEEIGLAPDDLELVKRFTGYNHGIVLVTGPTGSGKTTTLYAALSRINSPEKNILTIEDPIEYHLEGISQIQVNNKKGLTFAAGLRSLLRQDPDVIMVGEIRDEETARIAIQAALTGHLVFSTVHTNDSASTVTRLVDIGVEPYLVASSVICVIAQRLVRLICPDCKTDYVPDEKDLREVGIDPEQVAAAGGRLWRGKGCARCYDTGYTGRTAIYEVLPIGDAIRAHVIQHDSASVIKQTAVKSGLKTLRMDGIRKVLEGRTTVEEVLRVTQMDVM
ncbi:MAG: type II secretion system protein GspE [Planctomycetota bacterium]|nr:MAG: type II secretion system protein GspE [Planctomycetota bacterium]